MSLHPARLSVSSVERASSPGCLLKERAVLRDVTGCLLKERAVLRDVTGCLLKERAVLRDVTGCLLKKRAVLWVVTGCLLEVRAVLQVVTGLSAQSDHTGRQEWAPKRTPQNQAALSLLILHYTSKKGHNEGTANEGT